VPLLYVAKTGPNLSDLFKSSIELFAPLLSPNQGFLFAADGLVPGKTNYFQFTTDLSGTNTVVWQTLLTNVLATNRFIFVDTNAIDSQRLYRVLESF